MMTLKQDMDKMMTQTKQCPTRTSYCSLTHHSPS